jgi:hypothetical protein
MSEPSGGTQQPPSETIAPGGSAIPPTANRLLHPHRSFTATLIILIVVIGVPALLTAIGISRLGRPIEPLGDEAPPPPPKGPDCVCEQHVEPTEPLNSFVLDAARSYLTTRNLPVVTVPQAKNGKAQKTQ